MKYLHVLKTIGLILVFAGFAYLLLIKDEKIKDKKEVNITNESAQEVILSTEKLINSNGSYEYKDEKMIISVNLPNNEDIYKDKIQSYGEDQIDRFLSSREDIGDIVSESFPWNLDLDYKKYESDTIVSYIVQGYEYTGGAHGNTFLQSFNYDKKTGKQITIEDIVTNQSTFINLSALAKKELTIDYPEGVDEKVTNWNVWYADNTSVTFIFVPYQIAAYAVGQQELRVDLLENNVNLFKKIYFTS